MAGQDRETIERLAEEPAARFESLVFNREAYDVLATLIQDVAARIEDRPQQDSNDPPAAQALRQLVDDELVPPIAYEFIRRFGWPPPK